MLGSLPVHVEKEVQAEGETEVRQPSQGSSMERGEHGWLEWLDVAFQRQEQDRVKEVETEQLPRSELREWVDGGEIMLMMVQ